MRGIFKRRKVHRKRALGKRRSVIADLWSPLSVREKTIYGSLLVAVGLLVLVPIVRANISDVGSLISVPSTQCVSVNGWTNTAEAEGQPSVGFTEPPNRITERVSANTTDVQGSLTCLGFRAPDDIRTATAVNFSLRALEMASLATEPEAPPVTESELVASGVAEPVLVETEPTIEPVAADYDTREPVRIDGRSTPILPNIFGATQPEIENRLLEIEISADRGETWQLLHIIDTSLLGSPESHLAILLPDHYTEDISRLSVRIATAKDTVNSVALSIDSVFLTYKIGLDKELELRALDGIGKVIEETIPLLSPDEEMIFELSVKDPNDGIVQGIVSNVGSALRDDANAPQITVSTTIVDSAGNVVAGGVGKAQWRDVSLNNTDKWNVPVAMPRSADPGRYLLKMDVTTADGSTQRLSQDFLWGVLALNTNKTIYAPGETGRLMMTVLDETGATICDAQINLKVTGPDGSTNFSTNDLTIVKNDTCEKYGPHITPDYETSYQFGVPGEYILELTAITANGSFTIVDRVLVEENSPFVVSRNGPTRIFPIVDYPMTIDITANASFSGTFTETMPASFTVTPSQFSKAFDQMEVNGDTRSLRWNLNLSAGETVTIGYRFDAPDIAPEFYLLGPLLIETNGQEQWREVRSWQIAGDAVNVFRVTTYEIEPGVFTGTNYALGLTNALQPNYFTMISGPANSTASRGPDDDSVRVSGDPHNNFGTVTSSSQLELRRGSPDNDWIGTVVVVECMLDCSVNGFTLAEVREVTFTNGGANALQTVTDTLLANHGTNTVPFGGRYGGGFEITGGTSANNYATSLGVKIEKVGSNQIRYERFGAENRAPFGGIITTYIVNWGTSWTVQTANVTGTNSGDGANATGEYNTATIASVTRNNTWVWGNGHTRDDGLGDGSMGQLITLGNGVAQNTTETRVAVGAEGAMRAPGRDFQIYVMEHANLAVDYRFKVDGDGGASTGYQELNQAVDASISAETYNNTSATVRYTSGQRIPLVYTGSGGTGQAYSRSGAWGLRHTTPTNIKYWRAYAGQPFPAWFQSIDFDNIEFTTPFTEQLHFQWRDDSTPLNTSGGFLAAENSNAIGDVTKRDTLRLRFVIANIGDAIESVTRTYELQFSSAGAIGASCSGASNWVGVGDATDAIAMAPTINIDPDGQATSPGLLVNSEGYIYVNGEGRDLADTTGLIGPLPSLHYTELEYSIQATDHAVAGHTYCFRVYDLAGGQLLDGYRAPPLIVMSSTTTSLPSGLGETGSFNSAVDGGWTTVNFTGTYTTPVVVGLSNSHSGQPALVFEAQNITSTSAQMRICESEGSASNGCDAHPSEIVGYMVIDAAVASSTAGIDAGTFTTSGRADHTNVTTSFSPAFSATPIVLANVNTVNDIEQPTEVVIRNTSASNFNSGLCEHLQGSNDLCDPAHGTETIGWVAFDQNQNPFGVQTRSGTVSIRDSTWTAVTFTPAFSSTPVLLVASQTDNGGQDVEIDEGRNVTTTGADIRYCEIDAADTCDTHAADTVAWLAIEPGLFMSNFSLDQDTYRFYAQADSVQPGGALAAENTELTGVALNDSSRIRIGLQAGAENMPADSSSFKLQYGVRSTTCSAITGWLDVGAPGSATAWRGFDNPTPVSGDNLTTSLLNQAGNVLQSYVERNNAPNNPNAINTGQRGEWDWTIENHAASLGATYCFRMIIGTGETINYTVYPTLSTSGINLAPSTPTALAQTKTDDTALATGNWTNENSVKFTADVSDANTIDTVQLCIEIKEIGTAFVNSEDLCSAPVIYSGTPLSASVTMPGLVDASQYHWQARTLDGAGLYSSWVSYGGNGESARDVGIDTSIPTGGVVYDGSIIAVDIDYNNGSLSTLNANWDNFNFTASGLGFYEYSIGTSIGATDIKSWTSTGATASVTSNLLTLNTSQVHYFNVRATDNAGNVSAVISSDGQFVAPTLSFTSTPNEVQFDALGAGNNHTSVKSTTLTTSTNAYNGYIIRAWVTGPLTNQYSATIPMFSGGTYAAPAGWQIGDFGFGYTSNDSLIQGSNIFVSLPCLGGGNPPCYAPYSLSAPGDIVADHTALVSGTPIINENFVITHRVTTTADQEPGNYRTTIIFTVTAVY